MSDMPDPVGSYNFFVTLDPGDAYLPLAQALLVPLVANGAFQEVKGLGADLEVLPYPEGGVNNFVHQLPVRHSWQRLSLRRGVARGPALWDWYHSGLTGSLGSRRNGAVFLLLPDGVTPAVAWTFEGGIAVKWTGPEMNAQTAAVAIESLEIAHHGLTQVPLGILGA
jgi:phage tail-like protein